nr:ThrA [Synechococcus elongatus PCC 7942 = FACHB-805]
MQREGGDFGPILADAQRLGYAEADPTADVDGWDAADKIAILASLAFGGRVERSQITCEGIRAITASDIAYAEGLGFTIKLLAKAKRQHQGDTWRLEASVYPTLVPLSHPLASVNDVYNAILVEGDPVGQVMFFGPGAGAGPTASAVVADILNIAAVLSAGSDRDHLDPLLACRYLQTVELAPAAETAARFYLRIVVQDSPGVIGKVGTIFGEQGISLESIVQTDVSGETAELVVITHEVQEGIMRQAITQLEALPLVQAIANLLHVL